VIVMTALLLGAAAAAVSADTLLNAGTTLSVYGGAGGNPPGVPTSATLTPGLLLPYLNTQTTSGPTYHSTDTYDFDSDHFLFLIDQARGTDGWGFALSSAIVNFTVTADTPYAATGHYYVQDNDLTQPGKVFYDTYLADLTAGSFFFFQSYDESLHTPDVMFELGDNQGDTTNIVYGSFSGMLAANHEYQLFHCYYIQSILSPTDGGATATGTLLLNLASPENAPPVAPLPAASVGGLALIGGFGISRFLRRRGAFCGFAS
jgi:hypothetical protein